MTKAYFDDILPDRVVEFGDYEMTQDEIISFAKAYDPQPFHTQVEPPPGSGFPKLIASGWHTAAVTMRMMVDNWISTVAVMPSPGLSELRFRRPVFPGDRLRVRIGVIGKRKSESKPDRGIVEHLVETLNQNDEVVLSFKSVDFIKVTPS
jgi:acyl dehydratase